MVKLQLEGGARHASTNSHVAHSAPALALTTLYITIALFPAGPITNFMQCNCVS